MVRGEPVTVGTTTGTVQVMVRVATWPPASWAVKVTVFVYGLRPTVPLTRPAASALSPAGRPVTDHVYGAVPPVAPGTVEVTWVPTTVVRSPRGPGRIASRSTTVQANCAVSCWSSASVTVTETVNACTRSGVPITTPCVLIDKPDGSPVAVHRYGGWPPVAAGARLTGVP